MNDALERTRALWAASGSLSTRDGLPWRWGRAAVLWPGRLPSRALWREGASEWTVEQRLDLLGIAARQAVRQHWAPLHEWRVWHRGHPDQKLDAQAATLMWRQLLMSVFPAHVVPPPPGTSVVYCMPRWYSFGHPDGREDWPDGFRSVWDYARRCLSRDVCLPEAETAWVEAQERCWALFAESCEPRRRARGQREEHDPAMAPRQRLIEAFLMQSQLPTASPMQASRARL
jgi:hypothetical protein